MIKLGIRYLEDEEIVPYAADFLKKHNREGVIPVPIEEIIDLDFSIDIIPAPGIRDLCDVEGFISPDFSAIYVDLNVYNKLPYRYKFTLAHEIAHLIIHGEKLSNIKIDPNDVVNSWARVLEEIDNWDHSKMEYQGYTFGGLVLVPPGSLSEAFNANLEQVEPLIKQANDGGLLRHNYLKHAIDHMAQILSPIFDVSTDVLTRRIEFDGLDGLIE